MGYIYKITNIVNNKIYIGKTVRTIKSRFSRHINDAESGRLNTHLSRAIRKYGKQNFKIEEIEKIDNKLLEEREIYWINFYKSSVCGYNETLGGDGGNTYINKTPAEMEKIKSEIRMTKVGGLNPNARAIKMKNIKTGEELFFDSAAEARDYFKETNHQFVSRRCLGMIKVLWRGEWLIAYQEENYPTDFTEIASRKKSREIYVIDLLENKEFHFPSFASAERYFGLKLKTFSSKAYLKEKEFVIQERFKISIIN